MQEVRISGGGKSERQESGRLKTVPAITFLLAFPPDLFWCDVSLEKSLVLCS